MYIPPPNPALASKLNIGSRSGTCSGLSCTREVLGVFTGIYMHLTPEGAFSRIILHHMADKNLQDSIQQPNRLLRCKPSLKSTSHPTPLQPPRPALLTHLQAAVVNETRNQTYKRLASLASPLVSEDDIYSKLEITNSSGNNGNKVTNDLKLHIKEARLRSVHVSPTVLFNGNVDNSVSSGWSVDQWKEWLEKNIV